VVGLGLFLVAHLCYGLAFLGAGARWMAGGAGPCGLWRVLGGGGAAPMAWESIRDCVSGGLNALSLSLMMAGVFSTLAGQASLSWRWWPPWGRPCSFFSSPAALGPPVALVRLGATHDPACTGGTNLPRAGGALGPRR